MFVRCKRVIANLTDVIERWLLFIFYAHSGIRITTIISTYVMYVCICMMNLMVCKLLYIDKNK